MAITPLYGSHITFVGEGPRSLEPHAHRIICGPFGLTPGTPNQYRYILLRYSMRAALPGVLFGWTDKIEQLLLK